MVYLWASGYLANAVSHILKPVSAVTPLNLVAFPTSTTSSTARGDRVRRGGGQEGCEGVRRDVRGPGGM